MDLVEGGVDSRGGYILKIVYVKTKELGPLGGHAPGAPPPRSANAVAIVYKMDANELFKLYLPCKVYRNSF